MKIHGSCSCGFLTFEAEADPEKVTLCHCTDCQSSTGTAFRTNVRVPGSAFRMLSGTPTIYIKTTADSGNPRARIGNSNHLFHYPRLYRRSGKRPIARCLVKIPHSR